MSVPSAGRVALVGDDRQIHLVDPISGRRRPLTLPRVPSALARWGSYAGPGVSSWPCWAPDGRWISCFQARDEDAPLDVVAAVEVDGVQERELVTLHGRLPIYASWASDGRRLAVLLQAEEELELGICDLSDVGRCRPVIKGVPLFFCWSPEAARLFVHVGAREGGNRLLLQDLERAGGSVLLADGPGSFCAPVYAAGRPVYVSAHLGRSWLSVARADGGSGEALGAFDGLVAVLPDPRGPRVLVGAAPRGEGTPYEGLWLAPLDGGPIEQVSEEPCMAFFWDPQGERVITARVDLMSSCLRWSVLDLATRRRRDLCPFWPSREMLFYLHFFEQFAQSHSLLSPDGRTLVFPSYAASEQGTAEGARCHVLALDLYEPDPQPRSLGEGTFGVFSPV